MNRIKRIQLSLCEVPLKSAASDAKVLTGRQRPLTHVSLLFAEIISTNGIGFGFSYALRSGGNALFSHAKDLAPLLIGEDANDIGRLWEKLAWQSASVSRTGVSVQAIAALDFALWDLKAKCAQLPLGKLLGTFRDAVPCYNTSSGYLSSSLEQVISGVDTSIQKGIGGIKIKVGQPDFKLDLERVRAVRSYIPEGFPLMVDANQQWDLTTAIRAGRKLEEHNLTWIEEPLYAYDYRGHAELRSRLDTPIGTGEMLSSVDECERLLDANSVTYLMPDAPRIGGVTPFLRLMAMADQKRLRLAPHFVMELHIHLACSYPHEAWVEHFDWLEPAFNERLTISDGKILLPQSYGLGITPSKEAIAWTVARSETP
jgi:L-alanine-DL-glutamate epimerase-like enolase superfamily enzyme